MSPHSEPDVERLSPLDLLMPGTYVQACLVFDTLQPASVAILSLQQGLKAVTARLPWVSGRIWPVGGSSKDQPSTLMNRWNDSWPSQELLVDKGVISSQYEVSYSKGMQPRDIPAHVWPSLSQMPDDTDKHGAPLFSASIFTFADAKALGLCVCVHHNAVDATGFAELMKLWAQAMRGHPLDIWPSGVSRMARLSEALQPELKLAMARPIEELWALHPEHSRVAPALPSEFSPSTSQLFRISTEKIDRLRQQVSARTANTPTTTNLVTALMWQAVTRVRARRNHALAGATSRLVTAVNVRSRIGADFSVPEDPYFGNAVLYALADCEVGVFESENSLENLSTVISESQSDSRVNRHSIAEIIGLVDQSNDYKNIFVGWDLFSSRDFTVTSWNGLGLYEMDFGHYLGKARFVRPPYLEADGVGFVLPKPPLGASAGAGEYIEVVVMLRRDDMAAMMEDCAWAQWQVGACK